MRDHARVARANALVAHYGLGHGGGVTRAQRCEAQALHDYDTDTTRAKAGVPRRAWRVIVPRACARGIELGLVRRDGYVKEADASVIVDHAVRTYGLVRFRTLVNNALASRTTLRRLRARPPAGIAASAWRSAVTTRHPRRSAWRSVPCGLV